MPRFVPRQRKHKVLQRQKQDGGSTTAAGDSNAAEIWPASKGEKEDRRRRLKEELRAQQPKMSSKKQKRLDKYIVRANLLFEVNEGTADMGVSRILNSRKRRTWN